MASSHVQRLQCAAYAVPWCCWNKKKGKKKNSVNPTSPSNNNTLRTRTVEASLCQNKSLYLIRKLLIMMNLISSTQFIYYDWFVVVSKNSCLYSWCKRFHCTLLFVNYTPNKPVIWSRGINSLFLNISSWPCLSISFCAVFSFLENEHQKNLSSLNEPVVFPSCNYGPVTTDYMPEQSVHRRLK